MNKKPQDEICLQIANDLYENSENFRTMSDLYLDFKYEYQKRYPNAMFLEITKHKISKSLKYLGYNCSVKRTDKGVFRGI